MRRARSSSARRLFVVGSLLGLLLPIAEPSGAEPIVHRTWKLDPTGALEVDLWSKPTGAHPPTVWEAASQPLSFVFEQAHRSVGRLLAEAEESRWRGAGVDERLILALHLLEGVGASRASDVRVRFDLGKVLYRLGEDERAVAVLEGALELAPDHPDAAEAYFSLGIARARADRTVDEIAAWNECLKRDTSPVERAIVLSNRGEAWMVLGKLAPAIVDYRASIEETPDQAQAHWGLAVALDRTGDQTGAQKEAKLAVTYDPLEQKVGDFFVPPYDRYWYEGLGSMARAAMIEDLPTAILWWETAAVKWSEYIAAASESDRWLPLAKLHRLFCERTLEKAKKKASRLGNERER